MVDRGWPDPGWRQELAAAARVIAAQERELAAVAARLTGRAAGTRWRSGAAASCRTQLDGALHDLTASAAACAGLAARLSAAGGSQ